MDEYNRPANPGESSRFPILVGWGRPRRNNTYADDWLYLAREDGLLMYLQLKSVSDMPKITGRGSIGRLDCDLGSAFAIVDTGLNHKRRSGATKVKGPDVILAVGELGNGGRWEVGTNAIGFSTSLTRLSDWSHPRRHGQTKPRSRSSHVTHQNSDTGQ